MFTVYLLAFFWGFWIRIRTVALSFCLLFRILNSDQNTTKYPVNGVRKTIPVLTGIYYEIFAKPGSGSTTEQESLIGIFHKRMGIPNPYRSCLLLLHLVVLYCIVYRYRYHSNWFYGSGSKSICLDVVAVMGLFFLVLPCTTLLIWEWESAPLVVLSLRLARFLAQWAWMMLSWLAVIRRTGLRTRDHGRCTNKSSRNYISNTGNHII